MNILETTIAHLGGALTCPVSSDVPAERPDAFVTVERAGGPRSKTDDSPLLTVQAWHRDRLALETLADSVCDALLDMPDEIDGVFSVDVSKSYFPEQIAGTFPRYVLTCTIYCRH